MMTMTQTETNNFEVGVDGQWAGRVWVANGEWTAQDFDGDTTAGFQSQFGAAQFVVDMLGAMR